jgi:hypothetical protein
MNSNYKWLNIGTYVVNHADTNEDKKVIYSRSKTSYKNWGFDWPITLMMLHCWWSSMKVLSMMFVMLNTKRWSIIVETKRRLFSMTNEWLSRTASSHCNIIQYNNLIGIIVHDLLSRLVGLMNKYHLDYSIQDEWHNTINWKRMK